MVTNVTRGRGTFEAALGLHLRVEAMAREGAPALAIARALGLHHTTVLHHLRGQCKCLPGVGTGDARLQDLLRRELREMETRAMLLRITDRRLLRALRRALLAVGLTPYIPETGMEKQ